MVGRLSTVELVAVVAVVMRDGVGVGGGSGLRGVRHVRVKTRRWSGGGMM